MSEPLIHYLADPATLTVLCGDFRPDEKYTLDPELLTCDDCFTLYERNAVAAVNEDGGLR